jgi:hypothetical protein
VGITIALLWSLMVFALKGIMIGAVLFVLIYAWIVIKKKK